MTSPPDSLHFRTERWSVLFEPDTASLRDLKWRCSRGGTLLPVLDSVYMAVRDENWDRVPLKIFNLVTVREEQSVRLSFIAEVHRPPVSFEWRGKIHLGDGGELTFEFEGRAQKDFPRNRIGFCVLHAADLAGQPVAIEHVDGQREEGAFPERIAPHQPFLEVRALTHSPVPGCDVRVLLEGETFETEDQRNWTDASFKTYGTPLALPFPVTVERGENFAQKVTVSIREESGDAASELRGTVPAEESAPLRELVIDREASGGLRLPRLGLQAGPRLCDEAETERLRALELSHLFVEVCPGRPAWKERLGLAVEQAARLDVPLELVAIQGPGSGGEAALDELFETLLELSPPVERLILLESRSRPASAGTLERARSRIAELPHPLELVTGSGENFTELNRNRPALDHLDGVSYALNPQVHAFDDRSLVETLPIQAETLRSAREFVGDLPLHVAPVTLLPRPAPRTDIEEDGDDPDPGDPRQKTGFAAAWTLGSLKSLAAGGAKTVTLYETVGARGILDRTPGAGAMITDPVHRLLEALAGARESRLVPGRSSRPLEFDGFLLEGGERSRLFLANFTPDDLEIQVTGTDGKRLVDAMVSLPATGVTVLEVER